MPRPLQEKTVFARLASMAAHGMWEEYVALIDRMGVDWQATDPALPKTFVHEACLRLNVRKLTFLIGRGATLSVRDAAGKTPLAILMGTRIDLNQGDAESELQAMDAMMLLLVSHGEKLTSHVRRTSFGMGLPKLARHVLDHPPRSGKTPVNRPLSPLHLFVRGFVADDAHSGFPSPGKGGTALRLSMLFTHLLGRANPPVPASRWETLELIVARGAFHPHELSGELIDQVLMEGGYLPTPEESQANNPVGLLTQVFAGAVFSGIASVSDFATKGDSDGVGALRARLVQYALDHTLPAAGDLSGQADVGDAEMSGPTRTRQDPVSLPRKSRL
jgi:hypothetical protein